MKKVPEENLDIILQFCKDRLSTHHSIEQWDNLARIILENNDTNVNKDNPHFKAYIDQLKLDGYIKDDTTNGEHDKIATLKGLIFEGYVRKKERKGKQ